MKQKDTHTRMLTDAEIAAVCADETSLATYLSTLTTEQIHELRAATESGAIAFPDDIKKTFMRFLDIALLNAAGYEKDFIEQVAKPAYDVAVTMTLDEQIAELERIEQEL